MRWHKSDFAGWPWSQQEIAAAYDRLDGGDAGGGSMHVRRFPTTNSTSMRGHSKTIGTIRVSVMQRRPGRMSVWCVFDRTVMAGFAGPPPSR